MNNKIEVTSRDGWIIIEVREVSEVACHDESLDFHASNDGVNWFDVREPDTTFSEIIPQDLNRVEAVAYVRLRKK